MGELKPCPFCGNDEAQCYHESATAPDYWTIVCNAQTGAMLGGCGASCGYAHTKGKAVEKWNRRNNP